MRSIGGCMALLVSAAVLGCGQADSSSPRGTGPTGGLQPGAGPDVENGGGIQVGEPRNEPLVPPLVLDGTGTHPHAAGTSSSSPLVNVGTIVGADSLDGPDFSSDDHAHFHPHGKSVCASGCAASNHPTEKLTYTRFEKLLKQFASEPADETSQALETLLFFGRQSRAWLERYGGRPLDKPREKLLRRELARTHARISFRLVDQYGVVRCQLPPTRVPLDRRHVFTMKVKNLPPLVTSGTVKRVGLYHLWTRI